MPFYWSNNKYAIITTPRTAVFAGTFSSRSSLWSLIQLIKLHINNFMNIFYWRQVDINKWSVVVLCSEREAELNVACGKNEMINSKVVYRVCSRSTFGTINLQHRRQTLPYLGRFVLDGWWCSSAAVKSLVLATKRSRVVNWRNKLKIHTFETKLTASQSNPNGHKYMVTMSSLWGWRSSIIDNFSCFIVVYVFLETLKY